MSSQGFDILLNLVKDKIHKEDTRKWQAIKPDELLSLTHRFLAIGICLRILNTELTKNKKKYQN